MRVLSLAVTTAALLASAASAAAQTHIARGNSLAIEGDAIAYGINGYSGIINFSHRSGLQLAVGSGRYEVPGFLLERDANYDAAQWKATSTSIQVIRVTYRLNGPMKNGLALGAIVLNQNWRLSSKPLNGETIFRPLSAGVTAGYYFHVGKHFYLYPTTAFTYNTVVSGKASVGGTPYRVARFGPNGSLHAGWEFAR